MYLENIDIGKNDYDCRQTEGKPCNSCGRCGGGGSTPISVQEKYFFLFDTMCGRSSLRESFDGGLTEMQKLIGETEDDECGTDHTVDFLFGFAGLDYQKLTDSAEFEKAIAVSIDSGKPVIAKVKSGRGRFRVITGYNGGGLVCPDFTNAQQKPDHAPACGEIEILYVIGGKTAPRFTARDGLKNILRVMEYNAEEKFWDIYTEKTGLYGADGFAKAGIEEKKARMKRVADTMWHTFNCHNFAEVFRKFRDDNAAVYDGISDMKKLSAPEFRELWAKIGGPCYGYTHDLAWALIGLQQCADWTKHAAQYYGEMVQLTLYQIKKNDLEVMEAIRSALQKLT